MVFEHIALSLLINRLKCTDWLCACVCVSTRRGKAKKLTVFGLDSPLLAVTSFQTPPFALYVPTPSSFQ